MKFFPVLVITLIVLTMGAGCSPVPSGTERSTTSKTSNTFDPTTLIGTWHTEFGGGGDIGGFRDYTLYSDGTFVVEGYPAWEERGRYTVVGQEGYSLTIDFVGTEGEQAETYQSTLEFSTDGKTTTGFPGGGTYTKIK